MSSLRSRIDLDELLSQGLTGLLTLSYALLVFVLVLGAGTIRMESNQARDYAPPWWLTTIGLLAVLVTGLPVYRWLRGRVRELVYTQPENLYPAMAQITQRLESSSSPQDLLSTIAETIAHSLKLPYAEIQALPPEDDPWAASLAAAFGSPPRGALLQQVILTYRGIPTGELRVASRRAGEALSRADLAALDDLARQVGIALYAARLTTDLQGARERLVLAREEERRRIRNDLHDGLAPTLSSVQLQLGALRPLIRGQPGEAEAVVDELRQELRGATAAIRQLVYNLRPPLLDELGLAGALRSFHFPDSQVRLSVTTPEPMPRLPAAAEVAVYRIASEALHNVVKHAGAANCLVEVEMSDGYLELRVIDDGANPPEAYPAGVGLHSMQERAAELGGTLAVQGCPQGGTCVTARFPVEIQDSGENS